MVTFSALACGGPRCPTKYLETVACKVSIPSFNNCSICALSIDITWTWVADRLYQRGPEFGAHPYDRDANYVGHDACS